MSTILRTQVIKMERHVGKILTVNNHSAEAIRDTPKLFVILLSLLELTTACEKKELDTLSPI